MKDPFLNVVECNTVIPEQIKDKPNNIKENKEVNNDENEWGDVDLDPMQKQTFLKAK